MLVKQLLKEARRDDLTYTPKEVKGKVERLTVTLTGSDSKSFTVLAKRYTELDESIKALDEEKKKINVQLRAKVVDMFDAEDEVLTRVVETVSFSAQVAKQSEAGSSTDYEAIIKQLLEMVPDLKSKVDTLTKTYTKATKAREPALRVDSLKEGVIKDIVSFIAKAVASFKSWGLSYDKKLDALKAAAKLLKKKPVNESKSDDAKSQMAEELEKIKGVSEVEVAKNGITFSFKDQDFLLKKKKDTWDLLVNGYKQSLLVGEDLDTAKEAIASARIVNKRWFKENDPHADQMFEAYEDKGDYKSASAGTAAGKNDASEGWVHAEDIGDAKKDKALGQHLKSAVGASKEFIDAYIAQLYKSFKVKQ